MNFNDLSNLERAKVVYRQAGGGGVTYPSVLDDGNTVKWFDYTENVTVETGVSSWDNKSGITGIIPGALLQATGGSQPEATANGILFNGTSHVLKTAAFTLATPTMIYAVLKQITWTAADTLFDGHTTNVGRLRQQDEWRKNKE